jgi:hypothetical protein
LFIWEMLGDEEAICMHCTRSCCRGLGCMLNNGDSCAHLQQQWKRHGLLVPWRPQLLVPWQPHLHKMLEQQQPTRDAWEQ